MHVPAFGLQQYQPLIAAMRTGNVKLLEDALAHQQHQFIQEVTSGHSHFAFNVPDVIVSCAMPCNRVRTYY